MFEIGSSLREARVRQELDFPEIEHATKIRGKYLRALEEEQFDVLPAQTYVKGFLRTYAEYLGLDGGLYVDEYNSRFVSSAEETPLRTSGNPRSQHQERRVASKAILAVLAGIALVTALVIVAWKFSGGSDKPAAAPPPPAKKHVKKHAQPVIHRANVRLDIRATHGSGSYVEVRVGSSAGRQLYAGTLQPGHRQLFRSTKLWITVGAPANVGVRVNGHRRTLPGHGYPRVVTASSGGKLTAG